MSTTDQTSAAPSEGALADGSWRVDPARRELAFQSRGMFGLVPVRGTFHEYDGELTVAGGDAHGELRIRATSLDTKNATRDKHLRSADFFDTEAHETLTFKLTGVGHEPAGPVVKGVLRIKGTELELTAPLQIEAQTGQIKLSTALDVDRAAAGVGWSRAGMIKGRAKLTAALTLVSS